jgi:methylmalonyl-CoA mutase cobalamin-binding subunit
MPLTVCTVVMAKYVPSLRFLAILLGDEPAMSNEQRVYQRLLAGDTDEARALTLAALKSSPLIEIYDRILIPALELAERDRHAGLLTEEQESDIEETARELIDELGATARVEAAKNQPERSVHRARIMCIPLRDDADEISGTMLKQLLEMDGFEVELAAAESLTGELVDSVTEKNIDIAVISILPPLPARYSRLLCSRLRGRYPELPIVVGYWCGECPPDLERRLCADAGETATTLAAARERIMALCTTQPQIVEKVG